MSLLDVLTIGRHGGEVVDPVDSRRVHDVLGPAVLAVEQGLAALDYYSLIAEARQEDSTDVAALRTPAAQAVAAAVNNAVDFVPTPVDTIPQDRPVAPDAAFAAMGYATITQGDLS